MSLKLENISIGYNGNPLISNINAELNKGDICALLGKNGSGKSTLLKTILKFIPSLGGNIFLDKSNINDFNSSVYATKTAVVLSGKPPTLKMTVRDFLEQGRFPYHNYQLRPTHFEENLIKETIDFLGLQDMVNEPVSNLSDGNFQKVSIGRAIIQDTELILFDEPLSHLDVSNQQIILNIIRKLAKEKDRTIIFSTHEWNQSLNIANELWLLKNGEFKSGKTEDLALQEDLIPYFTPENYYYDYCFNQFKKQSDQENNKPVKVNIENGDSDAIFWLYKALGKENYTLEDNAEKEIEVVGKLFKVKSEKNEFQTNNIEELLQKLQE